MMICPGCNTEFVPPAGYLERKRREAKQVRCPVCYQAVIDNRALIKDWRIIADADATGDTN